MSDPAASVAEAIERIEFDAAFDAFSAADPSTREALGLISQRIGHLQVIGVASLPEATMVNRIMGVGLGGWDPEAFGRAQDLLHVHGCVSQVPLADGTAGAQSIRVALGGLGYVDGYAWMKFIHSDAAGDVQLPASDLRIVECAPGAGPDVGHVLAEGFGLPGPFAGIWTSLVGRDRWRLFAAVDPAGDGVGVGAMYVDGAAAWLGFGATLPAARGRGAQSLILRARIAAARAAGCTLIVTETGERVEGRPSASYRNILRAGFDEAGLRPHLVRAPTG